MQKGPIIQVVPRQTTVYQENERNVHALYLATFAKGNLLLSAAQQQQLADIAQQCPMSGGNAVYKARTMYQTLSDTLIRYSDSLTCAALGITFRQPSSENASSLMPATLTLYPNPTSSEVTLSLTTGIMGDVSIYNAQGMLVWQQAYDRGASLEKISVGGLSEGVYILRYLPTDKAQSSASQTFHVRR